MSLSSSEIKQSTKLIALGKGRMVSVASLKGMIPDVETLLFFAKAYSLDYVTLSDLLRQLFKSTVLDALSAGDHSTELQDYLVDTIPPEVYAEAHPTVVDRPPHGEILPQLWESLEVVIAKSIADVADKLVDVIGMLPGKEGQMAFSHLAKLNKQRPTVGAYLPTINHGRVVENLVILDVSGSMSERTVAAIISDVVALSWKANAHLAIVSNSCFHWEPGSYNVDEVLKRAEYGGTHYEMLTPLLSRNWGTVISIADYDSSRGAQDYIRTHATGTIDTVLDISLVNRPTFLGECLGIIAKELRPILVGGTPYLLS